MAATRILIVEDNQDNRRILHFRLRKAGDFDIREARDGAEAVSMVGQEMPDLIFMDFKMPVMEGGEAIRRIREMPEGSSVPIIGMWACSMRGLERPAAEVGCDEYIYKPIVDPVLVRECLSRHLPGYRG